MSDKSFDDLMRQMRELQELFPKVLEDQNLQQLAVQKLASEYTSEFSGNKLMPAQVELPPTSIQPVAIEVEDDELIDLVSLVIDEYGQRLLRMGTLQDAAKNSYRGFFGKLPEQRKTRVNGFWRPTYFYPKKWLTDFLEGFRKDFPFHWSECSL